MDATSMIKITDINGHAHYLAPEAIARVTQTGASSQWHGIRAIVKTFDLQTIEAQETAEAIALAIAKAEEGAA
jgi:hypothetical protein